MAGSFQGGIRNDLSQQDELEFVFKYFQNTLSFYEPTVIQLDYNVSQYFHVNRDNVNDSSVKLVYKFEYVSPEETYSNNNDVYLTNFASVFDFAENMVEYNSEE